MRHDKLTILAQLEIEVGKKTPFDKSDGPFEPKVIRRVLPDDQSGPVVGVVVRGFDLSRLELSEHSDLGSEITPDPTGDPRGVHRQTGDLGAQDVRRPRDCDFESVELVIQRAMAKDPKDRYATMADLERELAAFDPELLSRPSVAPPPESHPPDANAATVVRRPSPRAMRAALHQTQQSVKVARPGLLAFTGLGFAWLLANVAVAVGGLIRTLRGEASDLSQTEAVLSILGVTAALVTPLVLWVRHLMRDDVIRARPGHTVLLFPSIPLTPEGRYGLVLQKR